MDLRNKNEPETTYQIHSSRSADGKWIPGYTARMDYGEMIKEASFGLAKAQDSKNAAELYATAQIKMRIQHLEVGIPVRAVVFTKDDREGVAELGKSLKVFRNINDTSPAKMLPRVKFIHQIGERTARVTLEYGKEGPWGNSFTVNFNDSNDIALAG